MLTIYRASAGAGKTYRLTGDYLMLLFAAPGAFRRILAVTFTNKATDEMKQRIISELFALASGKPSGYEKALAETYQLTTEAVRERAGKALIEILHDYSAFNISTIDRFFQQTMRAFTREIGLQGGYGIEMDQDRVLELVVDRMISELDQPENKELLGWLLRFASEKVENGKGWDIKKDIQDLGKELFKESFKVYGAQVEQDIEDKQSLEKYHSSLYALISQVEADVRSLGKKALDIMSAHHLQPADFKGGSRSPFCWFEKWSKGNMNEPKPNFVSLIDQPDKYYAKAVAPETKQAILDAFEDGLNDCVREVVNRFENLTDYYTAKEIVRYYYTLGILTDISREIATYRSEKNVMLIADTTELLGRVIDGSDAPFIYEKTGTHVDHFMIDEFQDTSCMQWDNFRPLVGESLAHGNDNLIVGDVKQSIYRFRNSDWKLLDEQVKKDFVGENVREESLVDNWRSGRRIVQFNNELFKNIPILLQGLYNESLETSSLTESERNEYAAKIISAYAGARQNVPKPLFNREGHVKVSFIDSEAEGGWKAEALRQLPGVLETLQDKGYALKDIAVLVRTNKEGAEVADTLLAYKEAHPSDRYSYDLVSDEALYIGSSPAVRFLLTVMRFLKNPSSLLYRKMVHYAWFVLQGRSALDEAVSDNDGDFQKLLHRLLNISRRSLYEMVEELYRLFEDELSNEQVFVQAFLDLVKDYSTRENSDIREFLIWWDDSGFKKTIATPDGQNAIRIMTVHKSKGLGFKAVVMPFCNWDIDNKPVILWCRPEEAPFNQLHLVPVRYSQALAKTHFAIDYFKERLHAYIDNLNTLYVAFTRAKEELVAFAPRPQNVNEETGEINKISSIADVLWAGLSMKWDEEEAQDEEQPLHEMFDYTEGVFESGEWWQTDKKEDKSEIEEVDMQKLHSVSPDDRLHLRLQGKGYFFDDKQRKFGSLMHEILSRIYTVADIDSAVEGYHQAGIITSEEAVDLSDRIENLLQKPEVTSWYDGTAKVLNEVDILYGTGFMKRPDRVMVLPDKKVVVVDYKFGAKESSSYRRQVKEYLNLIRQMGYDVVEGYLWYVLLDKIEAVKV